MTLQLVGKDEPIGKYQEFYGPPTEQMPKLIELGHNPVSVAEIIKRRLYAPEDVIDNWRANSFFTGDGIVYDGQGNAKIVLDSALLREISPKTKLDHNAAVLSIDQWEDLHSFDILYLNADKVRKCYKKGFIKKGGIWQPENIVVGDVWKSISRVNDLKDLQDYAERVHEASGGDKVMQLWFDDRNTSFSPIMRSLIVNGVDLRSSVYLHHPLNLYYYGRLAGVVPETPRERCGRKQGTAGTSPYRETDVGSDLEERLEPLPENKPWYKRMLGLK
ncbi:MAG: hypothetical protein KKA62_04925 [Nanoarchaeota archaeon]|nr:hypothetical protein [Nanoarchaeota archaeon]MBU1644280.1 hypothetical protein [Nanoarchaeota archaeon]MBU1977264.1 hypothetical protein [Nanoarchaeota archaeon]